MLDWHEKKIICGQEDKEDNGEESILNGQILVKEDKFEIGEKSKVRREKTSKSRDENGRRESFVNGKY